MALSPTGMPEHAAARRDWEKPRPTSGSERHRASSRSPRSVASLGKALGRSFLPGGSPPRPRPNRAQAVMHYSAR